MKEVLTFLTACAVLAIVNAFTTALAVALLFAALMGAIAYPRRMFGLAVVLGLMALAIKEPLACVAALGTVGLAGVVTASLRRPARPVPVKRILLLPDGCAEKTAEQ